MMRILSTLMALALLSTQASAGIIGVGGSTSSQVEGLRTVPVENDDYRRYMIRLSPKNPDGTDPVIKVHVEGSEKDFRKVQIQSSENIIDTSWNYRLVPAN